ncbi:MAG: MBL fold metallo-hydrolase [Deltaproteobacteria bacterium]|nr:MAG: MBL fold metallo-hydrolase [Deltaproteobacteria bacterium]
MNNTPAMIREIDRIEILILADNYVDVLLRNTDIVTRPPLAKGGEIPTDALLAEHGLSMLLRVHEGRAVHTILFDTGYSQVGVPHNMELLSVDPDEIEALVLSHGHMDHTGSLYVLLDRITNRIPLVLHPDAFLTPRYFGLDDGRKLLFPQTLVKTKLEDRNIELMETRSPTLLIDDMVAVTGEVERVTGFEKGLPNAFLEKDGKVEKDFIWDDQALVANLKGKGLVIISGCAHAGIINTILHAKKITGVEKVHAVLGGFHLSGPFFEQIIEDTIKELKEMNPEVIVPMHCTGWNAVQRFSQEFPSSFVLSSVGSTISLA